MSSFRSPREGRSEGEAPFPHSLKLRLGCLRKDTTSHQFRLFPGDPHLRCSWDRC